MLKLLIALESQTRSELRLPEMNVVGGEPFTILLPNIYDLVDAPVPSALVGTFFDE